MADRGTIEEAYLKVAVDALLAWQAGRFDQERRLVAIGVALRTAYPAEVARVERGVAGGVIGMPNDEFERANVVADEWSASWAARRLRGSEG